MIDFTKETPLSLAAVAKRSGVAIETVRRWARGVGGLRLETAKLGGRRFTSLEAIQRFSQQGTKQKRLPFAQSRDTEEEHNPLFEESSKTKARNQANDADRDSASEPYTVPVVCERALIAG